jgi:hypothetical protein
MNIELEEHFKGMGEKKTNEKQIVINRDDPEI